MQTHYASFLLSNFSTPLSSFWPSEHVTTSRFSAATSFAGSLGQLSFVSAEVASLANYYRRVELAQDWRALKLEREV
jgi:hypothetical protein